MPETESHMNQRLPLKLNFNEQHRLLLPCIYIQLLPGYEGDFNCPYHASLSVILPWMFLGHD